MSEISVERAQADGAEESCGICGGSSDLASPAAHSAEAPGLPPLGAMLQALAGASGAVAAERLLCLACADKARAAWRLQAALRARSGAALGERVRALRRRLHQLTQKIDVFIVVGGGAGGSGAEAYGEDDIIMVDKAALAQAQAQGEGARARDARGDEVFQCTVCPMTFQHSAELRAHVSSHPADAAHWCWSCGEQCGSQEDLALHRQTHQHTLMCHLCNTPMQDEASLSSHPCVEVSACPWCGSPVGSVEALRRHAASCHGAGAGDAVRGCPRCLAALPDDASLAAHALTHRMPQHFLCGYDNCILRFATRNSLMSHIRKCHGAGTESPAVAKEGKLSCQLCQRTFRSTAALKRHVKVHKVKWEESETEAEAEMEEMELELTKEEEHKEEYLELEELEADDDDVKPQI